MSKKLKSQYQCQECGEKSTKWVGKCSHCGSWNSLIEVKVTSKDSRQGLSDIRGAVALSAIENRNIERLGSGISEFDRALGGGFAPGSLSLIGGDPGIGKSTLLLQSAANLAAAGVKTLYVSGEESPEQVKIRANRLENAGSDMLLMCETSLSAILKEARKIKPQVLIMDSIQTTFKEEVNGAPGSLSQIRECTLEFMNFAKTEGCITMLVGHVTKDGQIAGPRTLEHMVDTVMYFEGDRHQQYRILRTIKNRFGATNEIGVFEMTHQGLNPVKNPSGIFVHPEGKNAPGSVIACSVEGSRSIMFEFQALVCTAGYAVPQRVALGVDSRRLTILLALIEKFGGIQISSSDVFVSIAGGLKVEDPASDLALALAIVGNFQNRQLEEKTLVFGELGLGGEVRAINQLELRLQEAKRMGFEQAIIPKLSYKEKLPLKVLCVERLEEALDYLS